MLGLCLLPIVFCLALSFEAEPLDRVLAEQATELTDVAGLRDLAVEPAAGEVRALDAAGGAFGTAVAHGLSVDLSFAAAGDLDDLAVAWFEQRRDLDTVPAMVDGAPRAAQFLRERFLLFGWDRVEVSAGDAMASVAVAVDEPARLRSAHRVTVFGGLAFEPGMSVAAFVVLVQKALADAMVGFIGLLIGLFAASYPTCCRRARSIWHWPGPFAAARCCSPSTSAAAGSCSASPRSRSAAAGWRCACAAATPIPRSLVSIGTLTFVFAVLYSVAVLVGLRLRSSGMAALVAIGVWFSSTLAYTARVAVGTLDEAPAWLVRGIDLCYWVLPKVKDIDALNITALAGRDASPELREVIHEGQLVPAADWTVALGTTALFAAVVLGLAVWSFQRRDY
jgi:hypothetical protein